MLKELFICESRPQNEGRDLAQKLAEFGIKSEILLEAKIADYVSKIDVALIGMDTVLKNSYIN